MERHENIRIMIVDDHPVVRAGLGSMLASRPGWDVVAAASSGLEALAFLETHRVDVILMDLRMPGMSGPEAIRAVNACKDPPKVIVLTSFNTDEEIYQCVSAGAQGYLLKSASEELLRKAIRCVQQGERYFPGFIAKQLAERMARSNLTPREAEVLQLVAKGLTNKEIGRVFGITENTARNHVNRIIEKLDVSDRTEAATVAIRQGLVSD